MQQRRGSLRWHENFVVMYVRRRSCVVHEPNFFSVRMTALSGFRTLTALSPSSFLHFSSVAGSKVRIGNQIYAEQKGEYFTSSLHWHPFCKESKLESQEKLFQVQINIGSHMSQIPKMSSPTVVTLLIYVVTTKPTPFRFVKIIF